MEMEDTGPAEAAKTALWIQKLKGTLEVAADKVNVVFVDNQVVLVIIRNPGHYQRAKHIDVLHLELCG
jgi:hypothetical protein